MSQTSYNIAPSIARAGLVASLNSIRSRSFVNYSTKQVLITPTAVNSTVYNVTINGQLATYTSDGSATAAEITAGLVAAIAALTGLGVTATDNTGTYTLTANSPDVDFTYAFSGAGVQSAVEQIEGVQQVPFGCFVVQQPGVTPSGASNPALATCRLPYQSTDITGGLAAGVAMMTNVHVGSAGNTGAPAYQQQDVLAAMVEGEIWVQVEEAVSAGDPVYVRYATGSGGSQKGAFRKSADSSTAAQVPNGARYLDAASSSGFSRVALMLP